VSHTCYTFTASAGEVAQYLSAGTEFAGILGQSEPGQRRPHIVQARPRLCGRWVITAASARPRFGLFHVLELKPKPSMRTSSGHLRSVWAVPLQGQLFYSDDPFQRFFTFLGAPAPNNPKSGHYFPQTVLEQNQGRPTYLYVGSPRYHRCYMAPRVFSTISGHPYSSGVYNQARCEFDHLLRRIVLPAFV